MIVILKMILSMIMIMKMITMMMMILMLVMTTRTRTKTRMRTRMMMMRMMMMMMKIIINTYRQPATGVSATSETVHNKGKRAQKSAEGITQGDPLAMAIYVISVNPK